MKAVVIGALAATAYSATSVFSGVYTPGTVNNPTTCCTPTSPIKVTQVGGTGDVTVSVTFPNDANCNILAAEVTELKGKTITQTKTPSAQTAGSTVTLTTATSSKPIIFTSPNGATAALLNMDGISTAASGSENCKSTLTKSTATWTQKGLYEVDSTKTAGTVAAGCCLPTGDISIEGSTTAKITWTYDSSATGCADANLRGTKMVLTADPDPNTGDVYFKSGSDNYYLTAPTDATSKAYVLDLSADSTPATTCKVTLKTKALPARTYPEVYEVDSDGRDGVATKKCCYPDGDIKVTQDANKDVTVAFTFENDDDCYDANLKGKSFSAKGTPSDVTGDVPLSQTIGSKTYGFVLDYPSTQTGAWKLDLSDISATCGVTLEKKSGYVVGLGSLVALSLSYLMF